MTSPFTTSLAVETQQGVNIADAAAAANLSLLLFSSVGSADEATGIGHFDSKWKVEQRIAELGIGATVIAPVFFMDNFAFPWNVSAYAGGKVREAIPVDKPLQLLAAADIGRSGAVILQRPEAFIGQRVELVGDELTGPQIAEVLGAAMGCQLEFEVQPLAELEPMGPDMVSMYQWMAETGYSADADRLARDLPEVHYTTLSDWAEAQDWAAMLGAAPA